MLLKFDEVLGLNLDHEARNEPAETPAEVTQLAEKRAQLRAQGDFAGADELRHAIEEYGFEVKDGKDNTYTLSSK